MNDFICKVNFISHNFRKTFTDLSPSTYPFISATYFIVSRSNFIANITKIKEPTTYSEAKIDPTWLRAMEERD